MKALVGSAASPIRNSLMRIGLALRTFSTAVSDRVRPLARHEALPVRSPLKAALAGVTLKATLTLAPGATEAKLVAPDAAARQDAGSARLSRTPLAAVRSTLVKLTMTSWLAPGAKVCTPVGFPAAGTMPTGATS